MRERERERQGYDMQQSSQAWTEDDAIKWLLTRKNLDLEQELSDQRV